LTNAEFSEEEDDMPGSEHDSYRHIDQKLDDDYVDDSIHVFEGHTSGVYAVAWSPTSADTVATGGSDDIAFLWRVGENAFLENQGDVYELKGHQDTISSLAFNRDGSLLASGGMDGCVKIWEVSSGTCRCTLDGPSESIDWIQWHSKGDTILAGSSDFSSWMWSAQSGDFMMTFSGHAGPVTCGSFTPDGKLLVTGGGEGDATLRVWDPKTGQTLCTTEGPHFHQTGITCLAVHPNSHVALSGSESGSVKMTSIENGKVLGSLEKHQDGSSIEGILFLPSMGAAASGGMDGSLVVWDLSCFSPRLECLHPEGITKVIAHPTGTQMISGCTDGVVRCWDARTGSCSHEFHGHQDIIQDIAISPDGYQILTGAEDHAARVFDLRMT